MSLTHLIRVSGLGILATTALACHPHVKLHAPDATASSAERIASYEQLHARSSHETHITYTNEYNSVVGAARLVDYLQLADGRRVYHPEDLMPVLPPESSAYAAADRSRAKMKTARILNGVGWGTLGAGGAVMLVGVLSADYSNPDPGALLTPLFIGGGIMLAGVITTVVSGGFARKAMDEKATAFELYNEGLAMRLDVCADDKVLVPCSDMKSKVSPKAPATAAPPKTEAEPTNSATPTGLAGFEFSMKIAEARAACESAGHEWEPTTSGANCTGSPKSVGLPGRVHLVSCGDSFCELQVIAQTDGRNPFDEMVELKRALQDTYGPPVSSDVMVPDECRSTPADCLGASKAHMDYSWSFSSGVSIDLHWGQSEETGNFDDQIRIRYRRTPPTNQPKRAL